MTLEVEFPRSQAAYAGSADFVVGFSFESADELAVSVTPAAGGDPVAKVLDVDYVVTGDMLGGGAHVVFQPGRLPGVGDLVTIARNTPLDQPQAFGDLDTFKPSQLGRAIDRVTRMVQEARACGGGTVVVGGAGGGAAVNWNDILGKPATFPPSPHTHAQADIVGLAVTLAGISAAAANLALTNVSNADFASKAAAAGVGGGTGGSGDMQPRLLSDFHAVDATGATTAPNDAAIVAAESAADSAIYLPDGLYAKSAAVPAFSNLTKAYQGRGRWQEGTAILPARFGYMAAKPATPATQGLTGWFDGDQRFTDGGEYKIIGPNARVADLTGRYFEANTIPHHAWMDVNGGSSGGQAFLTAGAAAGATVIALPAAADASWVGKTVGFATGFGTAVVESHVVTAVNTAGNNITLNAALANTYTWNPAAGLTPSIYFHPRTSASFQYNKMVHAGGGDAYNIILRQNVNYVPKATERHPFQAATGGNIGGDTYANADGVYMQNQEWQLQGQTFDVNAIGYVSSHTRNNDFTIDRGRVWLGTLFKADGTRPSDAAHVVAGAWRNGLDTAFSTFYETSRLTAPTTPGDTVLHVVQTNGAHPGDTITVGEPGHIAYTGTIVSIAGLNVTVTPALTAGILVDTLVSYPQGGAALNLAKGHRIVWNSFQGAGGRGADPAGVFANYYGNHQGDIITETFTDTSGVDVWTTRIARGATSAAPDIARIRVKGDNVGNGIVQLFGTGVHQVIGQGLSLSVGCNLDMNLNNTINWGNVQVYSDGVHLYATKDAGATHITII